MPKKRGKTIEVCFIISIIFADQISKFFARSNLNFLPQQSIPIIKNFFHLTLVQNKGTAFGLFKNQSFFFVFISLLAVISLFYFLFFKKGDNYPRIALCLILGGAVGNLIDRLVFGFVIDFLDFRIWPVFNLADSFICIGAGLMLIQVASYKPQASG
ncbi:MAG: signal peptidase II [Candidatus Omnitrophica bacterium]|nr:signal peptidase II [Candidatus Omnitrophota bacterium]